MRACVDCRAKEIVRGHGFTFHVHHKRRVGDGGTDHPRNLVILCPPCHRKRHPRHPPAKAFLPLKVELVRRGIKRKDLAEAIGRKPGTLSQILNGRWAMTHPMAVNISRATGIPLAVILPDGDGATA